MRTLAIRLREARRLRDWTAPEVERRSGVNRVQVYDYEAGRRVPSVEVLCRLALCYSVSTDWLLGLIQGTLVRNTGRMEDFEPSGRWAKQRGEATR